MVLGAESCLFGGGCTNLGTSITAGEGLAILQSPGGVIEAAGTTNINPYGANDVAIAFIIGGQAAPTVTSAMLSSLAGWNTSVEACAPLFGSGFSGCGSGSAGMASRTSGTGNSVTFTHLGSMPILGMPATDGYVVYTNAPTSALVDPNNLTITVGTETFSFAGFGLTAPTGGGGGGSAVPEPGTLALLMLAFAGLGLARRRRPH
jgi:hypothetical protein